VGRSVLCGVSGTGLLLLVSVANLGLAIYNKSSDERMSCLVNFFDSLEALGNNFDLAYGMMSTCLRRCASQRTVYVPTWEDYDQKVSDRLEPVFANLDRRPPLPSAMPSLSLHTSS